MTTTREEILTRYAEGVRDFRRAELYGVNLRPEKKGKALIPVVLSGANFSRANLDKANLWDADLQETNFYEARLIEANLLGANLEKARLNGADLRIATLRGANLCEADLRGAILRGADLNEADLTGAKLPAFQIPQNGTLRVWKRAESGQLIELEIPAEAQRTATLVGRKCRAEFARVLQVIGLRGSAHSRGVKYEVGELVYPDSYDPDIRVECTHGIHFFLTREEAKAYGKERNEQ